MDIAIKNYGDFLKTLENPGPDSQWPETLKALWYDAKGDWEASHTIAQDIHDDMGSWIHAYLHRKEGDRFNAGYWYRQAGRPFPAIGLGEELKELVEYILGN